MCSIKDNRVNLDDYLVEKKKGLPYQNGGPPASPFYIYFLSISSKHI